MAEKNCLSCIHFEVCAICKMDLPICDSYMGEVVRCKDCEHYEGDECVCPYIWMSDGARLWPQPDDFCVYGERKVDESAM